jgi:predicted NBD/HSP70 family sugar kinase
MSSPLEQRDSFDAAGRGLQHQGLRRANERAVMRLVGFNPGVSNAEIARLSGLAPQTVSAILVDVERAGLITRGDVLRGRRGQPATPIFLRAEGAFALGCEIGWRHLDVVLINLHAEILGRVHIDYDYPDAATIFDDIAAAARSLITQLDLRQRSRLVAFGLAMPNNMWRHLDKVSAPAEQAGLWRRADIAAELGRRTGMDISIFNDGNAACWAELIAAPRPRPGDFIYLSVSRFIAAGLVGGGSLWEGPTGNAANLGAMLIGEGAQARPAYELASIRTLEALLSAAGIPTGAGPIEAWNWGALEPVLTQWLETSARALANVIHNATSVVEVGVTFIDGAMPRPVLLRLIEQIKAQLAALPASTISPPQILPGHHGALAPAIGAAELPLYRRYFSHTLADLAG